MLLIGDEIKEFARRQGADLVGFAPWNGWQGTAKHASRGFLPNARSVVHWPNGTAPGIELAGLRTIGARWR